MDFSLSTWHRVKTLLRTLSKDCIITVQPGDGKLPNVRDDKIVTLVSPEVLTTFIGEEGTGWADGEIVNEVSYLLG